MTTALFQKGTIYCQNPGVFRSAGFSNQVLINRFKGQPLVKVTTIGAFAQMTIPTEVGVVDLTP